MDVSDIEKAIVQSLAATLFNGPYQAGDNVVSTIPGGPQIRLYRGWPVPSSLDADLGSGGDYLPDSERIVNVNVFSMPGQTRPLPGRQREWIITAQPDPSVSLTVAGLTVALSGSPMPGTVVGISLTPSLTGIDVGYSCRIVAGDTLSSLAQSLAAAIPGATAAGSSVILPAGSNQAWAGSVADSTATMELRHQEQTMLVSVWAPSPSLRDTVSSTVDAALSALDRLTVEGIVTGPLSYMNTKVIDEVQMTTLWRRDLTYSIRYPTTISKSVPKVLFPWLSLSPAAAAFDQTGSDGTPSRVKIATATVGPKYPSL